MRSPLNPDDLQQAIDQVLVPYMREVERIKRIERELMRKVITHGCQDEGRPVPEGAAMEAQIDLLEALLDAGHHDQEKVLQLIKEMGPVIDVEQACLQARKIARENRNRRPPRRNGSPRKVRQ